MICSCCGFNEGDGVFVEIGRVKKFICVRDFSNPWMFFNGKHMLPMTYTLKPLNRKMMEAVMNYNQTHF